MEHTMKIVVNLIYGVKHRVLTIIRHYHSRFIYRKALRRLKEKETIRCAFFAAFDSSWKYHSLYQKMLDDPRFDPVIIICPIVNYGRDNMIKRMRDCASYFEKRGYKFTLSYDENQDTYLDIRQTINPDIIFYTNPYSGLVDKRYDIDSFLDKLSCYVPYFFAGSKDRMFYNLPFHKKLWRFYVENDSIKDEYRRELNVSLKNCVSVGYPSFDEFKSLKEDGIDRNIKKIIWAPHHLIEPLNGILRDGFLSLYAVFFELADKYEGKVEFVFRPHPLLKNKLYDRKDWGIELTNKYYEKWDNYPNCSIDEHSNYIQLFLNSDAMIHDCGSFLSEYLYVNKPVLFTDNTVFGYDNYFQVAMDAADCHYRGGTKDEIIKFIDEVVINGVDPQKNKRDAFIKNYIHPEQCVVDNIINDIIGSIEKQ